MIRLEKIPFYVRLFIYMANITLLVTILYCGKSFFIPLCFAMLISFLLLPICRLLERRKVPRPLAVFITLFAVFLTGGGILTLLIRQFLAFTERAPLIFAKLNLFIREFQLFIMQHFKVYILPHLAGPEDGILQFLKNHTGLITDTISVTAGLMINIALVIVYSFFFLLYRNTFIQFLFHLFAREKKDTITHVVKKIQRLTQGYIAGILSVIVIVAFLNSIGLWLIHIDNPILLGTFAACFAIIPYIGVFVGACIPLIVAFITKDTYWYAIGVIGISIVVHLLEGNIITPYFVGRRVRINPLTVVIGMFAGELLWGISGIVLSIPLLAIAKSVMDSVHLLKPYGYMLGLEISDTRLDFNTFLEKIRIRPKVSS